MSYKRFRDDIPKEKVDEFYSLSDNVRRNVFRALFCNADNIVDQDFLPYFLSSQTYIPPFMMQTCHYGMSVFEDLDKLKERMKTSKNMLYDRVKGYAFGFTNFDKGIWTTPNRQTHIEYFLFDWENNNPSSDFEITEKL